MTVDQIERDIGSALPDDYKLFLESTRDTDPPTGMEFPISEITPFGKSGVFDWIKTLADFEDDGAIIFRDAKLLIIADDLFGWPTCLSYHEERFGFVYYRDLDCRSSWTDDEFHQVFEKMSPTVENYLRLRREGKVPPKPLELHHFYHVADSFSKFQRLLKPVDDDE